MMTPPRFHLKCLGYPELRGADGKTVRVRVKKHLALLVFLAVERRRHHDRNRLVSLLWPRVSAEKGRHSISVAISLLRTVFGREAFPPHRAGLRFHPPQLSLDLERLESGRILGQEGEDDLDVDGAPEFALWKEREQARRLPSIHAGLLTLIDHGRRRGSHDEIMQRAERLLAIDHLAEEGIRAKMEALALVGDRFSALRVFEEWKAQLTDELGAEPSMMVEGMASQLRKRGWEPKEPNPVPAVPAEQWRDRRFVGRKQEFRRLYEVWEAVHQYRPEHFMIAGDSGVGKTTLAQRLVTAAGLEGASVSRVQCYQMEQRIPFGTIGALVAGLLGRPGIAATSPEGLAEVARIVPQVKEHFASLPAPKQAEGESARLLFAEGVIDLLKAVMEERPVLLVIDDLHHADEASLAVLHLVMRRVVEGRLMVLLCGRLDGHAIDQQNRLREAAPERWSARLVLQPMPRHEAEELLALIMVSEPSPPSPTERRALIRSAGGFPMVLELLANDWVVNGQRGLALGLSAMTTNLPTCRIEDDDNYLALAQRLLSELSYCARQVVNLAAVLGERLNDLTHYSLLDLSLAQTLDGMRELAARRVFRDVGNGLEFLNELMRTHVYRAIPSPHRILLHASVAERLLGDPSVTPSGRVGRPTNGLEIAWHLARAHRPHEASRPLLEGCREALLEGAPDSVVLSVRSGLAELDSDVQIEAQELLVLALHELGRWQEGLAISGALEGQLTSFRVLAVEARWHLGLLPAFEQGHLVLELLSRSRDSVSQGPKALSLAAFMAGRLRDTSLMEQVLINLSEPNTASGKARAELLIATAQIAFHSRRIEEGETAARLAQDALAALGAADRSAAVVEIGLGVFQIARGDYRAAISSFERAHTIAERLDNEQLQASAIANLAVAYSRTGELTKAVQSARRVSPAADPLLLTVAAHTECCSLALLNRVEEALHRLAEVTATLDVSSQAWLQQLWLYEQADVQWLCDRRHRGLSNAMAAFTMNRGLPLSRGATGHCARWSSLLLRAGKISRPEAENVVARLLVGRQQMDWLDRYEVLNSALVDDWKTDESGARLNAEFHEVRSHLEEPTTHFLQRFHLDVDLASSGADGIEEARL